MFFNNLYTLLPALYNTETSFTGHFRKPKVSKSNYLFTLVSRFFMVRDNDRKLIAQKLSDHVPGSFLD